MTVGHTVALMVAMVLAASWFLPSLRSRGRAALPLRLHNAAWSVALFLYGLPLINYEAPTARAWLLLYGAIGVFNIGAAVCLSLVQTISADRLQSGRRSFLLEWALPGLFVVGLLLYLRAIGSVFGLTALIFSPGEVRSDQDNAVFLAAYSLPARVLYGLGPLCFMTFALPSVSGISPGRIHRIIVLLVCVAGMALSLGRTLLLVSIVWTAVAAALILMSRARLRRSTRSKNSRRLVVLGGVVSSLAMFQFGAVVLGKTGQSDPAVQNYVSPILKGSGLTSLVVYLTGGIPSFSLLVDDGPAKADALGVDGPHLGTVLVGPLSKTLGWSLPDEVRPFSRTPIPHNAYTYLDAFWLDFREPGVVFLPALFGFGLTLLVARPARSREGLMARAILVGSLLWVPFSFTFSSTYVWSSLGYLAAVLQVRRMGQRAVYKDPSDLRSFSAGRNAALSAPGRS